MRYRRERESLALPAPPAAWSLGHKMDRYLTRRRLNPGIARRNGWYPAHMPPGWGIVIPLVADKPVYQIRRARGEPRYQTFGDRGDAIALLLGPQSQGRLPAAAIVEGPMDALAAAEILGLGVAMLGNAPPDAAILRAARLIDSCAENAILVPDSDSLQEAAKLSRRLSQLGVRVLFRPPPQGYKDLAEMPRRLRKELLKL